MTSPTKPQEVRFRLEDAGGGLSHPATRVTYLFEGETLQPGDSGENQVTIVVDMPAEGGAKPTNVQSLSSTFMVSDFAWEVQDSGSTADVADLTVRGLSLEKPHSAEPDSQLKASTSQRDLFSSIQRDAHYLSKRYSAGASQRRYPAAPAILLHTKFYIQNSTSKTLHRVCSLLFVGWPC
ncbi:hypothetical protein GGI12_003475 [Dipsacomyces acuminosporus]|nr:hypothetical protein GGI12_003475 [Dipsacomyces acuminosporus]